MKTTGTRILCKDCGEMFKSKKEAINHFLNTSHKRLERMAIQLNAEA